MPVLRFRGKEEIDSHHLTVPFCPLIVEPTKSFVPDSTVPPDSAVIPDSLRPKADTSLGAVSSSPRIQGAGGVKGDPSHIQNSQPLAPSVVGGGNMVIQGDNLYALKALMPRYAGKVNCIYIDPPYNTGNEKWVFNDNVNSPMMREWLGKAVDLEDLQRHDKWLCMMWPRLKLMKELLAEDGVLICAIDHNEQAHLELLLKEIFEDQEIVCVTVVHNPRGIQSDHFSYTHEYAYFVLPHPTKGSIGKKPFEQNSISWRNLRNDGGESLRGDAKNCFYPIIVKGDKIIGFGDVLPAGQHPKNKVVKLQDGSYEVWPIDKHGVERKWRYARQSVESIQHLLKTKHTKGLNFEVEIGKNFGSYKTVWTGSQYDSNEYGTKLLKNIIPECLFNFPKSLFTVKECLKAVCGHNKNAVILDSFAGSGTTAHAVLDLNKEDGGKRKFILVECEAYAHSITAERVRRVMTNMAKEQAPQNRRFAYCSLGPAIDEESLLKGKKLPDYKALASYIFYTATSKSLDTILVSEDFYIGSADQQTAIFVIYKPDVSFLRGQDSALHEARKMQIQKIMFQKDLTKAIVFATACFYDEQELKQAGITFCQLPFAIHNIAGQNIELKL